MAVFKILGATLKKITQLWLLEYLIIGLVSSTISMLVGIGISFIIVNYVFNIDMHIDYIRMLVLLLLIPVTIVFFSYIKSIKLIASKPLNILRVYF